ncbi:MAG: ABC-2 transporter permease [Candidatus Methanomethylophilaceae archaeon]|nr:ABC-2 transporter permease [Candidatus Methanomethylophilaceae archaeon]
MNALLVKEMRLSASILSYIFIVFAVMTMVPGYPILCGAFFITLGLFHSFQNAREANDIVYSALLPIAKSDVVKGKYQFAMMIELAGFLIMAILTVVRMTVFSDAEVYRENALMNANPFFLGMALVVFGVFNMAFIGGFFRTAYKLSPFVTYCFVVFAVIALAEAAHHFPGMDALNAFGFDNIILQIVLMLAGAVIYLVLTYVSYRGACRNFETIDL